MKNGHHNDWCRAELPLFKHLWVTSVGSGKHIHVIIAVLILLLLHQRHVRSAKDWPSQCNATSLSSKLTSAAASKFDLSSSPFTFGTKGAFSLCFVKASQSKPLNQACSRISVHMSARLTQRARTSKRLLSGNDECAWQGLEHTTCTKALGGV